MFSCFHHLIITKAVGCFITSNPKGLYRSNNILMHCLDWYSSIVDKAQVKFHVSVVKKSADFHCCCPRDFVYSRGKTLSVTEWFAVSLSLAACPASHNTVLQHITSAGPIQADLFPNIIKYSSGLHCWRQWITKAVIHRVLFSYVPELGFSWDTVRLVQKYVANTVNPVCPSADRCIFCLLAMVLLLPGSSGSRSCFCRLDGSYLQIAWMCTDQLQVLQNLMQLVILLLDPKPAFCALF